MNPNPIWIFAGFVAGAVTAFGILIPFFFWLRRRDAVHPAKSICRKHYFGVGIGETCPECGIRVEFKGDPILIENVNDGLAVADRLGYPVRISYVAHSQRDAKEFLVLLGTDQATIEKIEPQL
jgi:hypothetical protein